MTLGFHLHLHAEKNLEAPLSTVFGLRMGHVHGASSHNTYNNRVKHRGKFKWCRAPCAGLPMCERVAIRRNRIPSDDIFILRSAGRRLARGSAAEFFETSDIFCPVGLALDQPDDVGISWATIQPPAAYI